ncbi:hypothetical protein [Parasedimentitalea maritima]|uniref:Uncharacterized protein n=1 Tax=Parasedimentitalea maritima TaxID=2578117 RepID=A0A6A4RFB0_9RHOB|nr:hypothetical protein [Zongyanglinia marina]KAE9627339.1 hypothetical protein GP644_19420 [Zongyanglinia marina]
MEHDFEKQRSETIWVLEDLGSKQSLPAIADFDFYLVPASSLSDPVRAVSELKAEGYAAAFDEETKDIWIPIYALTVAIDAIWDHEERITKIGLSSGYRPDGWGFTDASKMNEA